MKDRDEFLASVYAKRDAQLTQHKKNKKKIYCITTAAAACLVLTVGAIQMDVLDLTAGSDSVLEAINENETQSGGNAENTQQTPDDYAISDDSDNNGGSNGSSGSDGMVDVDGFNPESYYMLPCVTIEEPVGDETTVMHAAGIETVDKVQKWVDRLTEQGQVVTGDEATKLNVGDYAYIVSINQGPQDVKVYYLIGEVGWYE